GLPPALHHPRQRQPDGPGAVHARPRDHARLVGKQHMGDRKRTRRAVAAGVPATLLFAFANPAPAVALRQPEYPTWDEVQQARANEAAAAAKIEQIEGILIRLEAEAAELNRVALERGEEYAQAQIALDAATSKLSRLKSQSDAAQQRADESERRV